MTHSDVSLAGLVDFNAVSVEISPITIAGTDWFEKHFGAGAVSASVPKTVAMFEVVPSLQDENLKWS